MKASVIICTYNRSALLKESILSVQSQNFPAHQFEIVVVDNNSKDETKDVVESLAALSPVPLKYVFEGRQGLSYARNTGIENSTGEIVVFTDDDIEADPQWLKELIAAFDSPGTAAAGGPIRPVWPFEKPDWLDENRESYLTISEFDSARETGEFKELFYPWGANIAFRRTIFKTAGVFPTDLGRTGSSLLSNEELELCRKIEAGGHAIRFAPNAIIHHKIPPERLTKLWFFHRTYWQGRSDAVLDVNTKCNIYRQLRQYASAVSWTEIKHQEQEFEGKCLERQALGYLYQLVAGKDAENPFRSLRALKTFLSAIMRDPLYVIKEEDRLIAEKDRLIAEKDKLIAENEIQIADMNRQINAILSSWSWRLTAPLRKLDDFLIKMRERKRDG